MEELSARIALMYPLSEPAMAQFLSIWKSTTYEKGAHLLKAGQVSNYMYFVGKGAVRIYYQKEEKEITEWLALDYNFFFSIQSFFQRVPSRLAIHTLETSEVFMMHHDDLMQLCEQSHEIEKLFRKMITTSLILSQIRMESIQFENAHQRYQRLLNGSPDILKRVPLSYIASFLGITQETLSRVRNAR
ncbi:MAG: Crp/Fnr family transcriptional regulator [Chitinophagales bacterium]|nr:Crp/Fnr family transcriptional regulator [Chitinophagales bacterium]